MRNQQIKKAVINQLIKLRSELSVNQVISVADRTNIPLTEVIENLNGEVHDADTAEAIIQAAEEELSETLEMNND